MLNNTEKLIASHIKEIMKLLHIEETPSNKDTPKRIAKMYNREVFKTRVNGSFNIDELDKQMTTFPSENCDPVTIRVPFYSMCEHHWLPFFGEVTVTYIPDKTIIGLSKIPRVIKWFSQRPQLQERLTKDIGSYLVSLLEPKELVVRISAEHTCVSMRGAESSCETSTTFEYAERGNN